MKHLVLLVLLGIVSGCASQPSAISLAVVDDLSLSQALKDSDSFVGSTVRWGGLITEVENKADKTWVFLVGCYNSGTTLLAELLSQHPDISALSTEGHFITDQFVKDYDIGLPRMWVEREDLFRLTEADTGPDAIRIKKEWGMRLDLSKQVLLEKSPPNTAKVRWLQANFENAHFVAIVRNGYAVAEGITRKADPKHLINSWPIEMSA